MPQVSLPPLSAHSLYLSASAKLRPLLPSLPPPVRDVDVPPLFREPYILSGYRPPGLPWRCYLLSLFQLHNETLNVWSHLLAAVCVALLSLLRFSSRSPHVLPQRWTVPLPCALTYCSAAAHLLQAHSELAHYSLFFLDYVGVAIYQYGCALALSVYSAEPAWTLAVFLPAAAILSWLSCTSCCVAKLCFRRPYPLCRKLCQVVPLGVAYLLDVSPLAHRLATTAWTGSSTLHGLQVPVSSLHQVALFLLAACFFSCPVPERCSPGRYDVIGHAHQLFHLLLALCTLAQQEALFHDFLSRRPALLRRFGEERLLLACASFPCLALCSALTALTMRGRARARLKKEQR
uniref:Progestin and adipoQ receptor family member 8 n=1 Tax=Myripristis murdjan TaxID=586833 RepID=A0A667ZFJ6_9TELE